MRRITTGFAITALLLLAGAGSLKATTEYAGLLLVEVSIADEASASNEFVEIYNPEGNVINLSDVKLQYRSATGANWLTKASISAEIAPRGRLLISTYIDDTFTMSSGLAAGGGFIRLYDSVAEYEYDRVAWGSAEVDEPNMVVEAPSAEQSLKRLVDEDGGFLIAPVQDSWFVSVSPSPQSDELPAVFLSEDIESDDGSTDETEADEIIEQDETEVEPPVEEDLPGEALDEAIADSYSPIHLTELLIDPDKPRLDSEDEYIELFNPNAEAVDLEGYIVETGSTFSYSFVLPDISIPAFGYIAIYSVDSGLVLSNSSGAARVLSPASEILFTVPEYENAKADTVWLLSDSGSWGWSTDESPGKPNTNVAVADTATEARAVKRAAVKAATAPSRTSTKTTSNKASEAEGVRSVYVEPDKEDAPINTQLLAGMGGLTVLYAGYEYRTDIANRIYQARRYFRRRRENR